MKIINFFRKNSKKIDCQSVLKSIDVYPENSISLIATSTETGKVATGWVNLAYVDYQFKKCFPFNLQFNIEILENSNTDYGEIEDYFISELKKGCTPHLVARVQSDFGFIMDAYVDNYDFASKKLLEIYKNPNKVVDFGCGFSRDPKWKEYYKIVRLIS